MTDEGRAQDNAEPKHTEICTFDNWLGFIKGDRNIKPNNHLHEVENRFYQINLYSYLREKIVWRMGEGN